MCFASCQNHENEQSGGINASDNASLKDELKTEEERLFDIIHAISSPIETANQLVSSVVAFNDSLLSPPEGALNYNAEYSMALNLGVYSADGAYANLYKQKRVSLFYLSAIKLLADELKLGQFFDLNTIKRMNKNMNNTDSVIHIASVGFENMHHYLKEQKKPDVSIAIVTGGWIESLYLSTQVYKQAPDQKLSDLIANQKVSLNDIQIILTPYKDREIFQKLIVEIEKLREIYDLVDITYVYAEPTTKEVNGVLVVQDNTKCSINITNEQIKQITNQVKIIRNIIIAASE